MDIKIAERLRPFSHLPGSSCLLPGTHLSFQIFPALIAVHQLSASEPKFIEEIPVPAKGPVKDFTLQLDLEKGCIHVWGESKEGYFRYRILATAQPNQFMIKIEKGLADWSPKPTNLYPSWGIHQSHVPALTDRLSLGNHKSQDWEMIKRRGDLTEILPAWLRLGQLTEQPKELAYEGTAALLKICENSSKENVYEAFQNLFYAGFEGILSPRLADTQYQGFQLTSAPTQLSPLILLTEGAKAIRSLFFRSQQNELFILPSLPPQFHCGRFLHVSCGSLGLLDLEWSKKMIRRMVFHVQKSGAVNFHFPHEIRAFRLNGQMYPTEKPIEMEEGKLYYFDRFQK